MTKQEKYILIAALAAVLLLIPGMSHASYYTITDWLIPNFESFSPTPYWDISRWSWGYGTEAPGPTGTIAREQALTDMRKVVDSDHAYLSNLITRNLTANQWAALLSFSYNLGRGNADNLVPNINSNNDAALEAQWKQYVHAGGEVLQSLVDRRAAEWSVWEGQA